MIPAPLNAIGVMSGSSLDGVDLLLASFSPKSDQTLYWEISSATTKPYPEDFTYQLKSLHTLTLSDFFHFEIEYTQFLSTLISHFIKESGKQISVIGLHGHTFLHNPRNGYSIQLGRGETICANVGIPVVTDFRSRLIALGGEGAPLVPHAEPILFPTYQIFLNLGGIANISLHSLNLAFDFHACNQVLNRLANELNPALSYDPNGQIGKKGTYSPAFAQFLHDWDFLKIPPPKSLSNEKVQHLIQQILNYPHLSIPDKLHTFILHFADELALLLSKLGIQKNTLMVTGGGAFNSFLVEVLKEKLAPLSLKIEIPNPTIVKYKEALCFAYFATCVYYRIPWTLSNFTPQNRTECAGAYHHVSK